MRTLSVRVWSPPVPPERLRRRRREYDMPVVDGASPLVRPYLTAHEQQDRCRELAFMLLWQDCPGSYVNHVRHVSQGAEVA